ncbi:MAG: beta-xylosidase [Verrucomicrobiota bacterium]|jgi:xylan 1,4-beta-xylosidase
MRISLTLKMAVALFAVLPLLAAQSDTNPPAAAPVPFPVQIQVDAAKTTGEIHPIWRFFGADEPNYAYMKDGRKLIAELGQMRPTGTVFFRTHNLLNSGDGTAALKWGSTGAYHEDAEGHPVYDWTILDRIFDTYLENGLRPYAEIGFMPREFSIHPDPYQHHYSTDSSYGVIYTGWSYPPKDYAKWGELVFQWAKHCVDNYGAAEVRQWYWEVWNEADIRYWQGRPEEFYKLHDYAVQAVRRALPAAKVGGPDYAGSGPALRNFLEHCLHGTNYVTGQVGTPVDFISFHAKGAPLFTNDHVRMGLGTHLARINTAFRIISSFPELKDKPIIIGESDPDGCAACLGGAYGYRNGLQFASYTAASFARESDLADRQGVNLEGSLCWAFEFEDQPLFKGFRVLATGGIDLPVLNVFRMFNQMSGQRLAVQSDGAVPLDDILRRGVRASPDVASLASLDGKRLCVMVWHYHDDDLPGPDAAVALEVNNLPATTGPVRLRHFRIDQEHSDAYALWRQAGRAEQPAPEQYARLENAGKLTPLGAPETVSVRDGRVAVRFALPRQAVSFLEFEW